MRAHSRVQAGKGITITLVTEDDKVIISSYAMIAGPPEASSGDFLFQFADRYPAGESEMKTRAAHFRTSRGDVLSIGGDQWRDLESHNGVEDAIKLAAMNMLTSSQITLLAGRKLEED